MKIALGADHGGYDLKTQVTGWLKEAGHEVLDLGAPDYNGSDDYADFAFAVGEAVATGQTERGIVICGSGVGACIAANKVKGVRACLCHDTYSAHRGVEHDDMNVLVLGGRIIGDELARELVKAYLSASFQAGQERFVRRRDKILNYEAQ